ncbi:tautomerase family protein [Conexibacter sp. SYSU D00693]|uniref:tautomerase family protein n=1 Tax=Conexibacter sp. SYSU D00693 TaxID=2812560 RepID=UPI00196B56C1|nr:tautomerase family protein [Conexibacter sp. SYSU D00693]
MPLLEVVTPHGTLDQPTTDALLAELGATLLRWEGAPDTPFMRSLMWASASEQRFVVGGDAEAPPVFRVHATVPEGALSARRKAGFVQEATAAVVRHAGLDAEADGLRVWVLVHEVPDGNWGAGGTVVQFAQIRQMAAAQRAEAGAEAAPA